MNEEEVTEEFRDIEAAKGHEDVHKEALERFADIIAREEESRILSVEDILFLDGELDDNGNFGSVGFLSGRTRDNVTDQPPAPKYSVDLISPIIEQSIDDQREASINIKFRALGQDASNGLANTMAGLVKNIESLSDASDAYDNAYDEVQKGGYGGIQIVTKYEEGSFDQVARIEPIHDATQCLFFGPAKKATKEDALYAFHIWDIPVEEFKRTYPDAKIIDWENHLDDLNRSWFNSRENLLRVAAYWRKRPVKKRIFMMQDLRVLSEDDARAAIIDGAEVAKYTNGEPMIREEQGYVVERFIMNGCEVLKGPQVWPGRYIPLIPSYGIRSIVNGREIIRGRVRKGKDAQMIYDYTTSSLVEASAKVPLDFTWLTPAQADGQEIRNAIENAAIDKPSFLFYNPDPDAPGPPEKSPGATFQQGLADQRNSAKDDVYATVGAAVGSDDGTAADGRSGEAIEAGNRIREKGNSVYFSAHVRMVRHAGVVLSDLLPHIKSQESQERIIKPDGSEDFVTINQRSKQLDPKTQKPVIINDLSQSKFDTVVDVGPAYASRRQASANTLKELSIENPAFASRPDLIAKNLDIEGGEEMYESIREELINKGLVKATDDEREKYGIDEKAQMMAQLEPEIREKVMAEVNARLLDAQANQLNAEAQRMQADVASKGMKAATDATEAEERINNMQLDGVLKAIEGQGKMLETLMLKMEAGIAPDIRDKDNMDQQIDLIEEQQEEVSPGPSSAMKNEFGLDG